jgi:hypothetical protein
VTAPIYGTPEDWRRERPAEANARRVVEVDPTVTRPEPRLLDTGKRVAEQFVSDHMSTTRRRRPLAEFVAEALQAAERVGEERADARYSDLLDRIAGVVRQRTDLAAEQDRQAQRRLDRGLPGTDHSRWAAELRSQADAIRSTLDPAEQAEVAGRVQALQAEQS